MIQKFALSLLVVLAGLSFAGWPSFKDVGKDLIDSTGVVRSNDVEAVIQAGEKLQQANSALTQEQEYYLGRAVSALILKQYPLLQSNPTLTTYLNQVGNAIAANSGKPEIFGGYHFAILDTAEINALSAPGGFIFVSRGFLDLMASEDALAGVLAHEIAHVVLGHGTRAISRARLGEAVLILGKQAASSYGPSELNTLTDAFSGSVDDIFNTIVRNGYSRELEYEADQAAVKYLAATGYAVKGLPMMLDGIASAGAGKRGGLFDTHPSPADRKAALKLPNQKLEPQFVAVRLDRFRAATGK